MTATQAYIRAARYFRNDLGKIIFSTLLIGITTLSELAQPIPPALLVDCVLYQKPGGSIEKLFLRYAPTHKVTQILILAGSILFLRLVQESIGLWNGIYKIRIGYSGLLHVRRDLFRKLEELSLGFHRSRPQGDTIYRLGTDTNAFQAAFNVAQTVFINAVKLVAMSCIMLAMNFKLALIAISIMPILFWTLRTYGSVINSTSTAAARIEAGLTTVIQRSVASIGLVQAFGREEDEYRRFDASVRSSHDAWAKMFVHTMVYWLIIGMTFALGLSAVLAYGGYIVLRGTLTVGFLIAFIQYLTTQLYDPLYKLSNSGADLGRYLAGMSRVYEILDLQPSIRDAPDAIDLPRQPRVLKLENTTFGYRPETPILREVNATIAPGEMVAFVGSSGVGKSSLLNLLPRFYDPTGGALTLDGHDLRKIKLRALRKHIALVIQENTILAASVTENIAYGRPDATPGDIKKAAGLAGADAFIEVLPQGYDTLLDESGQNLSGGQRQRIAIARALVTEAPFLVLDEPTSALDPHNEQMITETLRGLRGYRTIVIVSHRLSTVFDCDRIYVMDAGRIVEHGTHDQLLALRGHYYEMARHQLKLHDDSPEALVDAKA